MIFILAFVALFFVLWGILYIAARPLPHLLQRSAHWTAKFRYRDYLPVILVLVIGLGVAAFAGDGFLDIAEEMRANTPRIAEIDQKVHRWARTTHTGGATTFLTAMTLLGTPVGMGIVVAIVAAVLVIKNHPRWAAYLVFTTAVGGLLNLVLKGFFERARPELAEALRQAHGYSFPSGHAMGSTIVFGALCYIAMRVFRVWPWRSAALALGCSMVVAIAASRIYLGVHWISDIGAGICAGLIWMATTTVAYETFRRIYKVRQGVGRTTTGNGSD